jgi:hypothetical protein
VAARPFASPTTFHGREPGGGAADIRKARKTILRLAAFVALLAVEALLLHWIVDSGLRRIRTGDFGVWNRLVDGELNADILISGSSRALVHYDAALLQARTGRTAFNIGLNGSQTDMQLARLRTYLAHNRKPAILLHNLDLFSFQVTHGGVYDPGQYLPYLGEEPLYRALMRIDSNIWKSKRWPLYGYAVEDTRFVWLLGVAGFAGWQPREDHIQGFTPRHFEWTGDFEKLRAANPQGVRFAIEQDGVDALEALLALCREQAIPVVLVYSPEYTEMQSLTTNRAEIFRRFEALGRKYGVPLWDFSASPISSNRANFYNSQHLNASGASLFSADVAEKLWAELGRLNRDAVHDAAQADPAGGGPR